MLLHSIHANLLHLPQKKSFVYPEKLTKSFIIQQSDSKQPTAKTTALVPNTHKLFIIYYVYHQFCVCLQKLSWVNKTFVRD